MPWRDSISRPTNFNLLCDNRRLNHNVDHAARAIVNSTSYFFKGFTSHHNTV
jgi:hypothetical protein